MGFLAESSIHATDSGGLCTSKSDTKIKWQWVNIFVVNEE